MTDGFIVTGSPSSSVVELSLQELFEKSYYIYETLQDAFPDTTSEEFKNEVSSAIGYLEEATRKVNILGIFSCNESLDEITTTDIKYLFLPALLGNFTLKLHYGDESSRKEILKSSEIYFQNFMERCMDYGVTDDSSQSNVDELMSLNDHCSIPDIGNSTKVRENKIRRYKRGKELKSKINEIKRMLDSNKSEEVLREYYMLLLNRLILEVEEDLEQIRMEKRILNHMTQLPAQWEKVEKKKDSKPMKPVIITRNKFQKEVYGAGYPSLPVMTVDEFYQKRYPLDDVKGPPINQIDNLQFMASDPDAHKLVLENEDVEKEKKIDDDDPEYLQYARDFDDWKDGNRRGCGNRKNMG